MPGADRTARRGQRHIDAFGHQDGGIALGAQHRQPIVEALLRLGARDIDPLARVGALGLGQCAQGLAGQRDRGTVTEVVGLRPGQRIEVGGGGERLPGRGNRADQGVF